MPSTSPAQPWYLRPWINQVLLLAVAGLLLLPGIGTIPLMDRDEPRFAEATWEMIERKDWIIPYFNDGYRFDKPVGSYWMMRPFFWIFGKTELAARMHTFTSAWLTAVVIQAMGAFLFSRRAGFWAALGWLTCFQVLVHGRLCVADMPMMLGITIAMWGAFRLILAEKTPPKFGRWWWVLVGGLSLGFLAKGPVALAVPVLGILLARWVFFRRPMPQWKRLQLLPLTLATLVIVGLWGIPALIVTKGGFYEVGIGQNVIDRGTEVLNGRVAIPGYYFLTAFISLLPWSAFIPSALRRGETERADKRSLAVCLLLGWLLAPYAIFTFYATQLPHYVMPGFPAFVLLLMRFGQLPVPKNWPAKANLWIRRAGYVVFVLAPLTWLLVGTGMLAATFGIPIGLGLLVFGAFLCGLSISWFWTVTGIFSLGALAWIVAVLQIPWPADRLPLRTILVCAGCVVLVLGLSPVALKTRRLVAIVPLMLGGLVAFSLMASALRSTHPVIALLPHFPPRDVPMQYRGWNFMEPSLVFYAGKGWEKEKSKVRELESAGDWMMSKPNRAGVFLIREWSMQDQLDSLIRTGKFRQEPDEVPDPDDPAKKRMRIADYHDEVTKAFPPDRFELFTATGVRIGRASWVTIVLVRPKGG